MLSVVTSPIMLSVIKLSVIMQSVVMLNVVAPETIWAEFPIVINVADLDHYPQPGPLPVVQQVSRR
jgi:hypothetical protein